MKRPAKIALGVVAAAAAIQLIPVPRTNPPVTAEVQAPPEVKAVLRRACYDCHSNETVWPWYSHLAPASWLLYRDVVEGRRHLNFSEWGALPEERRTRKQRGCAKEVLKGDMPPWFYLPLHPAARLGDEDKKLLDAWAHGPTSG